MEIAPMDRVMSVVQSTYGISRNWRNRNTVARKQTLKISADDLAEAVPIGATQGTRDHAGSGVKCLMCGTVASPAAVQCPTCGEMFKRDSGGHRNAYDADQRRRDLELVPQTQSWAFLMFAFSLFGAFALLIVVGGTIFLVRRNRPLKMAGTHCVAVAYAAVMVSALWCGFALWSIVKM